MANAPRGTGSAILVAAVITLIVSVVRLLGELQGWNETLFNSGKAALVYVLGAAVLAGGFAAAIAAGLIVMPKPEAPGVPGGMPWALGLVLASLLVAACAWPRLTATLFVYALLARIPVVVITFLAVANDWDTHYANLPPAFALPAGESKAMFLSIPQGTFWIAFTVLVGGLCGCLGAALARRKD